MSADGSLKVARGAKQANRWSGLWGNSTKVNGRPWLTHTVALPCKWEFQPKTKKLLQDLKMEDLVTQLDNYSRLGVPKLHHLSSFPDEDQVEEGEKIHSGAVSNLE